MRRFKIQPQKSSADTCIITGSDANHMVNVLRLKVGDRVALFDGAGREYDASIVAMKRGEVSLTILKSRLCQAEPSRQITVAQGFLKEKKMDKLVRQLTELGVSRWIPFFGDRSIPRPDSKRLAKRLARWQKIAEESLKQCRRARSPRIEIASDFDAMLKMAGDAAVKLVFWEEASAVFSKGGSPDASVEKGEVFIILGPEGGLAAAEVDRARQAGFQCVSLGPRILRAETATIAAGTLVQYLFGDLGPDRGAVS